jgi:hypothetical protein
MNCKSCHEIRKVVGFDMPSIVGKGSGVWCRRGEGVERKKAIVISSGTLLEYIQIQWELIQIDKKYHVWKKTRGRRGQPWDFQQ